MTTITAPRPALSPVSSAALNGRPGGETSRPDPRHVLAPRDVSSADPLPLICRRCGSRYDPAPIAICKECLGPLDPFYDRQRALPSRATIEARPASLWRYREWLPFEGLPAHSLDTGCTPLVEAPALARAIGVARAWVKNDSVSHPTLSFKDRVVAAAINAASAFGLGTFGCASTGNLANAVAAHAARAGLPAWIFIPHDLELGKVVGTLVYGAHVVRVRGTYDDVNRLCAQVADHFGWGIANVNLRSYYGEGSKTVAFEIAEQLGWRLPTAVIAPMAGGSLVTKLRKGFAEFHLAGLVNGELPRLYGAQATGCQPIARLVESRGDRLVPEIPRTIARSIAIGNPADGLTAAAALRETGGWAAAVSDEALVRGIRVLAESTGIFTETAGGATVAAALALAQSGHLRPDDEVVLCITGNGLKTVEAVTAALGEAPVIAPRLREVESLVAAAGGRPEPEQLLAAAH
ncbi:MAG: threonine synthase [Gemmatimonadales bacterium]